MDAAPAGRLADRAGLVIYALTDDGRELVQALLSLPTEDDTPSPADVAEAAP